MNKLSILFLIPSLILMVSCNKKINTGSTDPVGTFFINSPNPGLVTLSSDGFGSNLEKAETDAIHQSFETVLFRGVPEYTGLSRPLIASESKFNAQHPNWLNIFISSGQYQKFIHRDYGNKEIQVNKGKRINKELTINYKNLRKHLEEAGLIRTFGY